MRHSRFYWLPTMISIFRLWLIGPYAASFMYGYEPLVKWRLIFAIVIIAADKIDGMLARKLKCVTTLGSAFDTIADSVFVLASWALFYGLGLYGLPILILLLAPRLLVLLSICILRIMGKKWNIEHLPADKIGGGLQYLGILWLLAGLPAPILVIMNILIINYVAVFVSILTRYRRIRPITP